MNVQTNCTSLKCTKMNNRIVLIVKYIHRIIEKMQRHLHMQVDEAYYNTTGQ